MQLNVPSKHLPVIDECTLIVSKQEMQTLKLRPNQIRMKIKYMQIQGSAASL